MNDKERLKEIEDRYEHQKETAEYAGITMTLKDYEFLIQQAKELHGTKGRYGYKGMWALCNRDYGRLNTESERYKQALEVSYNELHKLASRVNHSGNEDRSDILKTLEYVGLTVIKQTVEGANENE